MSLPYIRVDDRDNVAIILHPEGFTAREHIPQSNKIALKDFDAHEPVIRYGQVIGYAASPIPARFLDSAGDARYAGTCRRSISFRLPPAVPAPSPPLEGYTFEGYRNADGSTGTRNILGITTTVQCVAPTVDYAVRRIKTEILPRYPNVDDVVAITHTYGCGVAIDAPGAAIPIRTIRNLTYHPNIGSEPMIVSLGCEKLQPQKLFPSQFPVLGARWRRAIPGSSRLRGDCCRHYETPRKNGWPFSTAGAARRAPHRNCRSACSAAAATRSRASPAIPPSVMRPTCWCAPAPRCCSPKSPRSATRFIYSPREPSTKRLRAT